MEISNSSQLVKNAIHTSLQKASPPLEKGDLRGFYKATVSIMQPYEKRLKKAARALRKNMTDAELALWQRIRRKQIHGVQFYRQKPLFSFIVDFYCPKAKLVVELDGSQHFNANGLAKDRNRDAELSAAGLRVLRFNNLQVLKELDALIDVIWREVGKALENPP
jgi:very-short-patch-repair endonuclease